MKRSIIYLIYSFAILISILCKPAVCNGDRVYSFINPTLNKGKKVLPDRENRGLVAQFMDPENVGLGKSLGFLIRGQVRTAIKDPKAGIIVAYLSQGQNVSNILEKTYHLGAVEIARKQECYMALWGVIWEKEGKIFLKTFLSLLPEERHGELLVRFAPVAGLEAEFPRTMFNFPLIETTRNKLFENTIQTKQDTALRTEPDISAPEKQKVPNNTTLETINMKDAWFEVKMSDGTTAYIPEYHVKILNSPESLPVVHLMAGLYQYAAKNYKMAAIQFDEVIYSLGEDEDNIIMAAALQFKGASLLLNKDAKGLQYFEDAIFFTPYDPAAYNLVALASLVAKAAVGKTSVMEALESLKKALQLDDKNERTLSLIKTLNNSGKTKSPIGELKWKKNDLELLNTIKKTYHISYPNN